MIEQKQQPPWLGLTVLFLLIVCLALLVAVRSHRKTTQQEESTLERVQRTGRVRIGYANGEITARELCESQ